jgi:catechol 2,3-dioxygenase-like lactoylglutathione lyase family enzyme
MITGGNVTVYVSDMDRAVDFYIKQLGLKVGQRFGNHWAEIRVGARSSSGRTRNPARGRRLARAVRCRSG